VGGDDEGGDDDGGDDDGDDAPDDAPDTWPDPDDGALTIKACPPLDGGASPSTTSPRPGMRMYCMTT
jgi:hypothetical protein